MSVIENSQSVWSKYADEPVVISKNLSVNSLSNQIHTSLGDGVNELDILLANSAYGATPAGTALFGKYEVTPTVYDDGDATPLNTDQNGKLNVNANITSASAAEHNEDDPHTTGDTGVFNLSVRSDTPASTAGTDGDYAAFITDANGALYTNDVAANTSLDAIEADIDSLTKLEDAAHTTGDAGVQSLAVRKDSVSGQISSNVDTNGDYASMLQDENGAMYSTLVDSNGNKITENKPLPVQVVAGITSGNEVNDYQRSVAVASSGTATHTYTVTGSGVEGIFKLNQLMVTCIGPCEVVVEVGPTATLAEVMTLATTGSTPKDDRTFNAIEVATTGTGIVKLTITNLGNKSTDITTNIIGSEV